MNAKDKSAYLKKIRSYEIIIKTCKGVLYVKGRPGEAKTAIMYDIAKRNGWRVFDIRLAQVDSSEVNGIPYGADVEVNGKPVRVTKYMVPEYIIQANQQASLIIYDEINRAPNENRNAALRIFNERSCGDVVLNDNVYMVAMGNLGEEDGTEVYDMDSAMNNRLIHKMHILTLPEWKQGYADENVHPTVLAFIESDASYLYRLDKDRPSFATPRSWDNFSALLKTAETQEEFLEMANEHGPAYIGSTYLAFCEFAQNTSAVNVNDILNDFERVKDEVKKFNRSKVSQLVNALSSVPIKNREINQIENLKKFLRTIHPDETAGFFNKMMERNFLTDDDMLNDPKCEMVISEFIDIIQTLQRKVHNK